MLLLREPNRLLGSIIPAWQTWDIDKSDRCSSRTKKPYNRDWNRVIVGLCSAFRRLVPNFACKAARLSGKLEKDELFRFETLNENEMEVLKTLQHWLLSPPVLLVPTLNVIYMLDTDTCDKHLGCILCNSRLKGQQSPWFTGQDREIWLSRHTTHCVENVSPWVAQSYCW